MLSLWLAGWFGIDGFGRIGVHNVSARGVFLRTTTTQWCSLARSAVWPLCARVCVRVLALPSPVGCYLTPVPASSVIIGLKGETLSWSGQSQSVRPSVRAWLLFRLLHARA